MQHLPHKTNYFFQTLRHNPSELVRIIRIAWTTGKCRFLHRCAGAGTVIGEGTVLINTANIDIGAGCLLQDRVYIRAGVQGSVILDDGAALNSFVQVYGHGGVRIGKSTQIGPGTIITTTGHDYRATDLALNNAPIDIGERVWIGANCSILPGVSIGDRAVVGAGAVVTSDIPGNCVAVGVPARIVRYFNDQPDDTGHSTPDGHADAVTESDDD
jgi:acetyltransferase-like isoleucine patch superfamily enzyme